MGFESGTTNARRAWPNASPIGKKILVGRFPGFAEVVGVTGDVKNNGLAREPMAEMYTPYPQRPWPAMQFAVRSAGVDALALVNAVRAAVQDVDRELPITRVETMDAALADSISTERLTTWLLFAFAAVALVMAAAGLYGVIAYTVAQRTQEIGVRVALGADPRAVVRLVAAEGLRLTAAGMIAGTKASRRLSQIFRLSAWRASGSASAVRHERTTHDLSLNSISGTPRAFEDDGELGPPIGELTANRRLLRREEPLLQGRDLVEELDFRGNGNGRPSRSRTRRAGAPAA